MTRKTSRADGRGHWPRGRRRSEIAPHDLRAALARLNREIERGRSRRELADMLEVSDRTVRRWLAGDDYPTPEAARRIMRLGGGRK